MAGFRLEYPAGFELECMAGFIGTRKFGALGSTRNIGGVTDLDNRNAAAFAGGFAEFRYLALERTSDNPLSVTLAFEPNVRLIDETS